MCNAGNACKVRSVMSCTGIMMDHFMQCDVCNGRNACNTHMYVMHVFAWEERAPSGKTWLASWVRCKGLASSGAFGVK